MKKPPNKSRSVHLATIKKRYCLNGAGSDKKTFHIELDTPLEYAVGDRIGIYPQNEPHLIKKILDILGATGAEIVTDAKGEAFSFKDFLLTKANLNRIPKKLLTYAQRSPDYLETHNLLDLIRENSTLNPQTFCDFLSPLLPRFYSIASSKKVVGDEIHLTVALTTNPSPSSTPYGTCSHFLCYRAPIGSPAIPIFLQRSKNFFLPPESQDKPIIMIGPGTGIAPFRGFMQERITQKASAKNWLFFGERRSDDYYYQSYWEKLVKKSQLLLDCAFSRDQKQKVYVQHRMYKKSNQIWKWLNEGAYLFVCGDASQMAKDVHKTLHQIIEKEGNMDPLATKVYIKNLKKENRYLRDIY